MIAPSPPGPADRFVRLIEGLCRAVATHGAGRALAGPLAILLWCRLRRMAVRFTALAIRLRPGTWPARLRQRSGKSGPPAHRLPQNFAWLVRLLPEAAVGASQLQHLLADPDMAALIAAAPQAGRVLRPLCRMLGVRPPPALTRPPRPRIPARPRPAAPLRAPPGAEPAPPSRPPSRAWLRRTGLPGRLRPLPIPMRS